MEILALKRKLKTIYWVVLASQTQQKARFFLNLTNQHSSKQAHRENEKNVEKNAQSHIDLWDHVKQCYMWKIRVPEIEKREKKTEQKKYWQKFFQT